MRDIYLLHKSIEQELQGQGAPSRPARGVNYNGLGDFFMQFVDLFRKRRLRNALISSSIVALAQQLCGSESIGCLSCCIISNLLFSVNILAFYSGEPLEATASATVLTSLGTLFKHILSNDPTGKDGPVREEAVADPNIKIAMYFSIGFGISHQRQHLLTRLLICHSLLRRRCQLHFRTSSLQNN